jgi:Mce-associated membrane protein
VTVDHKRETNDVDESVTNGLDETVTDEKPERTTSLTRSWIRRNRTRLVATVLAVLIMAAAALAVDLYYFQYRPDQKTDPTAAHAALVAASDGTVAVLSYSPDSLDRDFATAKSHLTGDFLSYYNQFTQQIVAPAAKQKATKTTATVIRAAVSELHPDSAVVLVFVNQSTTSSDRPEPTLRASSVLVTVSKVSGAWLISLFDVV